MEKTKKCKDCGRELPLDDFYYKGYGNYFPRCKECEKVRLAKYRKKEDAPSGKRKEPGSACIRGYCYGMLHRKIAAAIIKSK